MIAIDGETIIIEDEQQGKRQVPIGSPEGFRILSKLWLRSGWDAKYVYSFTWLGRPIIQLPDDMLRFQELVYRLKPDVIVEIGIAHGGSLIYSASLCQLIGKGRVIGVDIEIRPHNRKAIEEHPLSSRITMFEGNSIGSEIIEQVRARISPGETVLVCLDGCHTREHVLAELEAYSSIVSVGSYILAMDGIMQDVVGAPRTEPDWEFNNPQQAAKEFVAAHDDFILEEPVFPFNEGEITERVTYWPNCFVKRIR